MALLHLFAFALTITQLLSSPLSTKTVKADENYRLPDIYTISSYNVNLKVPPEAFTNTSDAYTGTVTITFVLKENTDSILLHAAHDFITLDKIKFDGEEVAQTRYSIDNVTDILEIMGTQVATGSEHTLNIEFTSKLSTADMSGFYKSSYVDKNGVTKYLGTTQFESTYARRAFPCFDEPSFKAKFAFTITYPEGMKVLFNTKAKTNSTTNGSTTVVFNDTPILSTYLLAFIISEFTCTDGDSIGSATYQVCSRNESSSTREFAVKIGPKLLAVLNEFTGYDYAQEIEKMDQVAIPDFAAGAMENWGLVTYRETALLWDKVESSNIYKQRVGTVIAHEFAHQWFGNLVTMKWWSETFLNEGFARYFEYHATHEVVPEWELDKQFVIEQLHVILASDAIENAQALQSECSSPTEISDKFGTISYNKGASVLRMASHFMEKDNFKKGLQSYLNIYKHTNTKPENLWTSLNSASQHDLPASFHTIMENWIQKPGFPLLTVSSNAGSITITQERFLISGADTKTKWYVPVSYTTSNSTDKFATTVPSYWLTPTEDIEFALSENTQWVIINNQQTGYYRVNYDSVLWEKIQNALRKDSFDGIAELNRAQLVDDLFNLAKVNKIKYSKVFDIAEFLANDTSYYSWYPAFSGFNFLLRRVGDNSVLGKPIASHILSLMTKLYESVPIKTLDEEKQIYTLNQVQALTWACRLGNENCVEEVKTIFNNYKDTGTKPNKNLRSIVYCNALRYSENTSDWSFLWEQYIEAADLATEQVTLLSALGCTKDTTLLEEYLKKSITDGSGIRTQDAASVFSAVYSGNTEGVAVAFKFLMDNYEEIGVKYNSLNSQGTLVKGIAERFTTQAEIDQLKDFINTGDISEAFKISATEALETAQANQEWLEQFEGDLKDYYKVSGVGKISASAIMLILPIFFGKFLI